MLHKIIVPSGSLHNTLNKTFNGELPLVGVAFKIVVGLWKENNCSIEFSIEFITLFKELTAASSKPTLSFVAFNSAVRFSTCRSNCSTLWVRLSMGGDGVVFT